MMFPNDDMQVAIKAYLGADPTDDPGTWPAATDLSSRMLTPSMRGGPGEDIRITLGRGQNQKTAAAGSCTFVLDNSDGYLTPLHGGSPYYGTWDLGVPVSVDVSNLPPNPATVYPQFRGYVAAVEALMVPGTGGRNISAVKVTLGGILRRLGQGAVPQSVLRRAHERGALSPGLIAYWPLEDATTGDLTPAVPTRDLVRGYPAAPLQAALVAVYPLGGAKWSSMRPDGGKSSVQLTSARLAFNVDDFLGSSKTPFPTVAGQPFRVGFAFRFNEQLPPSLTPGEFESTLIRIPNNDDADLGWAVRLQTSSSGTVFNIDTIHVNSVGVFDHITTTPITIDTNKWHYLTFTISSSGGGADTAFRTVLDGSLVHAGTAAGVTYADGINFRAFSVARDIPGIEYVAHLSMWSGSSIPSENAAYQAFTGYPGETDIARFNRICDEDGIAHPTVTGAGIPLGPQRIGGVLDVLREAEAAGHGILYERTDTWGIGYRPQESRYNLSPAMTTDLATYRTVAGTSADVLRPVRNDQRLRNEITVTRPDGGSVTVRDDASIAKRGRYADSVTVNLASDGQLLDDASWRKAEGVLVVQRYQQMPLDLGSNPTDLLPAWFGIALGDRIDRTNHLAQHPPGAVFLSLEGYSSTIRRRSWVAELAVEPYDLLRDVMVAASQSSPGSDPSRAAHPGSTLALSRGTGDVLIPVTNVPAIEWGTRDLPYDLNMGGERVTLTAVSGTGTSQTLTVTRGVNGVSKTHAAGTSVQIWRPVHAAL